MIVDMKNIALFSLLSLLVGCSTTNNSAAPQVVAAALDPYLGKAVCFLLVDAETGQIQKSLNEMNCNEQLSPCSTFKIPLAIMGFESGVLKDKDTTYKWDGVKRMLDVWNQDTDATAWMKNSTVWYSQVMTPKIGATKIKSYLRKFEYGNQNFTGGLKNAWLTPMSPKDNPKNFSLKISAIEQIDFMKKFVRNKLPAKQRSTDLTKELIFLETTPQGYTFSGKTGSGFTDGTRTRRIGWFIGSLKTADREYVFATNFKDTEDYAGTDYGGPQAKAYTIDLLKSEGLW